MNSILEALYEHAHEEKTAERICLADGKTEITYRDAWEVLKAMVSRWTEEGVNKGDLVIIPCTQNAAYMMNVMSLQLCGAVPVPIEKGAGSERLHSIQDDTNARWYLGKAPEDISAESLPGAKFPDDIEEMKKTAEALSDADYPLPKSTETAEILFTTGTTGKPKGIVIPFSSDVALAQNVTNGVHMEEDNVELIPMPLSHSHGLRRTYANLYNGSTVVFANGVLLVGQFFKLLKNYKANSIDISPSMLNILFKLSKDQIADYKDQLRYVQLGSAPLTEEDKDRLASDLPNTRLYNFYGTTEAGCSCILDFNETESKKMCIGRPTVNAKFKFVDHDRNEIHATAENPGFIATAGSQNMDCYLNAPDLTASVCEGGFIYTNDLGYMDEDGYIYCLGREDDVINCGGIKIAPDEIETKVVEYDGVKDCACVPFPDKIQGQVPKLFISLAQPEEEFDFTSFRAFLHETLDKNEVPKLMEVLEEIPRTYNGKLQRKKLIARDRAAAN